MKRTAVFLSLVLLGASGIAAAKPWWTRGTDSNESDFLPPNIAFRVGSVIDGNTVKVRWIIADGYYLYKQKIGVRAESPDLLVGVPDLPPGKMKTDQFLGTQEIYTQQVEASVPYTRGDAGAHPLQIKVTYQGCAEAGLCYPPITKVLFPGSPPAQAEVSPPRTWETYAILGGALAFLLSGWVLRKGRRLDLPAT
jgi:thioredoxin:protein disulfide reductase